MFDDAFFLSFSTKDKVEIIVLGGTWSHYPRDYQDLGCVAAMSMLLDLQNHYGSWGNVHLMIMPWIISGNLTGQLNANTVFTRCLWHTQRNLFWLRDKTKIESVFRFW